MESRRADLLQGEHSLNCNGEKEPRERLPETLVARVNKLVQARKHRLLSTTSTTLAIQELVARTEALESAMREIALEVQKLAARQL